MARVMGMMMIGVEMGAAKVHRKPFSNNNSNNIISRRSLAPGYECRGSQLGADEIAVLPLTSPPTLPSQLLYYNASITVIAAVELFKSDHDSDGLVRGRRLRCDVVMVMTV